MKVKLTESQYEKIRLIKEAEDAFEKYKKFCLDSIEEVNKIYLSVTNSTVSEFLKMQINAEDLNRTLNKIEDSIYSAEKNALGMYERGLIGQGVEDFDSVIENLASSVTDRITSLTLIINYLEELQNKQKEFNLTSNFKEVKPIEIQSF